MSDIEQKARELLADEYEADGCIKLARMIRSGDVTDPDFGSVKIMRAMRAIIAALTPPEGYVLIKADTLADLTNDAEALIVQTEFRRDRIHGKLASVREARAMLAARLEVK